ncbi:formimidoylglutamase [Halosimplex carlsbadense 2-9-1]|uniref:Formimidoylglutamase n=1 Tax=Halosimplex carlsbadense 2-9-1 TaxID=797114 RepID=M0CEG4_9EURY|nr:formimidoylglutamase [Halosimplex carlsbadense]ELZ20279.1 formimidoylglutamase [Halosimplex carlsbadense 2-9-1]
MRDGEAGAAAFSPPPEWSGPSDDPNDEQLGDAVERASLEDLHAFDAVLVGEPYDGGVIGRRGAADGPAAIRESLAAAKTHHVDVGPVARDERRRGTPGHDHGSTGQSLALGDLGDVALPDQTEGGGPDVASTQERVREVTSDLYGRGAVPVFLGGDNSLTYPNAAPLLDRGSLGAISFDAHLDCREVRNGTGPTSGTPYRQLFADGLDELAVVGARNFETSTAYHDFLHEQGGRVFTPAEVAADPIDAMDDAIASLGDVDAIYVSVDVDVLDAAAAPGVSAPTPGGLLTRELYRLLEHVATHGRVASFEVVECAPSLDEGGRTVDAAARALAHFLASLAAPKGRHSRTGALDG